VFFDAGADCSSDVASDDDRIANGCVDGHGGACCDEHGAPDGFTVSYGYSGSCAA
jgi:hypothetical protein